MNFRSTALTTCIDERTEGVGVGADEGRSGSTGVIYTKLWEVDEVKSSIMAKYSGLCLSDIPIDRISLNPAIVRYLPVPH